jgi:succinate--hydroxymethylglutarate CoA-transferase
VTNKPLNGIKVVDFTRMFAGPFCTMLLADLGADVVKIESPDGDPIRHQGPPFYDRESMSFLAVNRNKRSIVLNAKQPEDLEIIHRLVDQADVLVENFLPGVMDRMGLSYTEVSKKKPQFIYASMSGMGANGPLRDKKAFDLTVQAEAGFMSLTGEPGGQPIKLGTSVFDLVCGQYATSAIITALYQRTQSGRGCLVETSLFEGLVSFLVDAGMEWLLVNNLRAKWGSEHASTVPYKAFKAKDGWIVIGAAVQRLYEAFVKVIGREDLATDPRFATLKGRVSNRVTLYAILDAEVAKWPMTKLAEKLDSADVPCALVNTMKEVFEHPQTVARQMLVKVPKPDGSEMPMIGSAMKFSTFDITANWMAPPALGQHTGEVLEDWLGIKTPEGKRA